MPVLALHAPEPTTVTCPPARVASRRRERVFIGFAKCLERPRTFSRTWAAQDVRVAQRAKTFTRTASLHGVHLRLVQVQSPCRVAYAYCCPAPCFSSAANLLRYLCSDESIFLRWCNGRAIQVHVIYIDESRVACRVACSRPRHACHTTPPSKSHHRSNCRHTLRHPVLHPPTFTHPPLYTS